MGLYIDPPDISKEAWLHAHAHRIRSKPIWNLINLEAFLPVVLADNGSFTVAGIAWCERELNRFTQPNDHRPKTFYLAPIDEIVKVCPAVRVALEEEKVRLKT